MMSPGPHSPVGFEQSADPWVTSFILARSHTWEEVDHEIISTAADSRGVAVSFKLK